MFRQIYKRNKRNNVRKIIQTSSHTLETRNPQTTNPKPETRNLSHATFYTLPHL